MSFGKHTIVDFTIDYTNILGSEDRGNLYRGSFNGAPIAIRKKICENSETGAVRLRRNLEHENIVRYHEIWKEPRFIYILIELCACNLEQFIKGRYNGPSPGTIEDMMLQVTLGLQYLHSKRIVHGNLKPQNILISIPKDGERPIMKLADFGLREEIDDEETSSLFSNSTIRNVGWHAPEVDDSIGKAKYTKQSDIFSLGCVYGYAFTNGHHPFGNDELTRQANIMNGSPNVGKIANVSLKSLISTMISKDSQRRPRLDEIFRHPMFSEIFGIRTDGEIVARYEWFSGEIRQRILDVRSGDMPEEDEQPPVVVRDGRIVQPSYVILTWQESDSPPQLEMAYSAQVKRIANLLLNVYRMNGGNKREYMKQIIRRALIFDVRMPKWLLALHDTDQEKKTAIEEAIKTLPHAHQAALRGDSSVVEDHVLNEIFSWTGPSSSKPGQQTKEFTKSAAENEVINEKEPTQPRTGHSDIVKNHVQNEIVYWSEPTSSSPSGKVPSPDEPPSSLASDSKSIAEENVSSYENDQVSQARRAMRAAWIEDRIPPAFYLAAASGHSRFCRKSIELYQTSFQRKSSKLPKDFKDFIVASFIYALYIVNDESIALASLNSENFMLKVFSKEQFHEIFPCSLSKRDDTKQQAVFVRLSTYRWFRVIKLVGIDLTWSDVLMTSVSLGIYFLNVVTDVILAYRYFTMGEYWPFLLTVGFVLLPAMVMAQWTWRTYVLRPTDFPSISKLHWTFRVFCLVCCISPVACHFDNILYSRRYLMAKSKVKNQAKDTSKTADDLSDLIKEMKCYEGILLESRKRTALVRLIEGFLESAPQILIQLYFMRVCDMLQNDARRAQYLSLLGSITSLAWAVTSSRPAYVFVKAAEPSWLVTSLTFISHFCWIFAGGIVSGVLAPHTLLLLSMIALHFIVMHFVCLRDLFPHAHRRFLYSTISIFTYTPDIPRKAQIMQILVFATKCILVLSGLPLYESDSFPSPLIVEVFPACIIGITTWAAVTFYEPTLEKFGNYLVTVFFRKTVLDKLIVAANMNRTKHEAYDEIVLAHRNECTLILPQDTENMVPPEENKMNPWLEPRCVLTLIVSSVSPVLYVADILSDVYLAYIYGTSSNEDYWTFGRMTVALILIPGALVSGVNLILCVRHNSLLKARKIGGTSSLWWISRIPYLVPCISYLAWYVELLDKCLTYVTARGQLLHKLTTKQRHKWELTKEIGASFLEIREKFLLVFLILNFLVYAPQLGLQISIVIRRTSGDESDQWLIVFQYFSISTSIVALAWAVTASNFSLLLEGETFKNLAGEFFDAYAIGIFFTVGTQLAGLLLRGLLLSWLTTVEYGWIAASFELLIQFAITFCWLCLGKEAFSRRLSTYPIVNFIPAFLWPEPLYRFHFSGLQS